MSTKEINRIIKGVANAVKIKYPDVRIQLVLDKHIEKLIKGKG